MERQELQHLRKIQPDSSVVKLDDLTTIIEAGADPRSCVFEGKIDWSMVRGLACIVRKKIGG